MIVCISLKGETCCFPLGQITLKSDKLFSFVTRVTNVD